MSVTGRIRAFQLILTLAVVTMAATAYVAVRAEHRYIDGVQLSRQQAEVTTELAIRANRFSEQIAELLLVGEPERPDFESARRQMIEQFQALSDLNEEEVARGGVDLAAAAVEEERLRSMRAVFRSIDRAVERLLLLDQQNQRDEAITLFRSEIENRLDADLERLIAEALADERGEVADADAAAKRLSQSLMLGTLSILGLLLAIAVGYGFQFSRSLRIPIEELAKGTQAIEHGDFGHRIAYPRRDEFGVLASRFNIMAENLQRQTSDLVAARDNLERQVEERTREIARVNVQLKEHDQQRVRFIGDVSHELRTPLTVLRAEAEVALRGSGKPEPAYRAALSTIVAQAADMSELVEDLLFIARSEADEVRFDFRHVLVAAVVSDAVQDARTLAHGRNLRISVDCGTPGPLVRADPRRLKQALIVVLENATQYADPQTEIEVETLVNGGDHAEIRVRDRGIGIRQDDVPHVFERFYRGANAAGRAAGSGLGLSIARWIVEKHDGTIDLVSTPGHGTEVRLFVPLAR